MASSEGMREPLRMEGPEIVMGTPTFDPGRVCTSNALPQSFGRMRSLGMVRGVTVRSRNIGADIGAGLKSLVGGEIRNMTTLCVKAREEALARMLAHATERGANGVVAIRYGTNCIAPNITEVIAYGMAVTDADNPTSSDGAVPAAAEDGISMAAVGTSNDLPGCTVVRSMGLVHGLTVRTRNVIASIGAGFKSLAGGEIQTFTKMCEDAREEAYVRMVQDAVERGADGVVAMRYETNEIVDGVTEVLAFGTAVSSIGSPSPDPAASSSTLPQHMVTTSNYLPSLPSHNSGGIVQGITVRSTDFFKAIGAGLKTLVGGEVKTWSKMCSDTRAQALERMLEQATQLGAKGVIGMRYDSNQLSGGLVEVLAYGTAVFDTSVPRVSDDGCIAPSLVTTDVSIPGHVAQLSLGIARGMSVRSTNLMRSIGAGLKSMVGGEIRNYTKLCNDARAEACRKLMSHAQEMGATAIVGMRYQSNDLSPGVVEVLAYGTAISDGSAPAPASFNPPPRTESAEASGNNVGHNQCTTANEIAGASFPNSLGVVCGITVRSRNVITNIGAGLKAAFVGGEISSWVSLCETTRNEAFERMLKEAADRNASGVVGVRYETNEVSPSITEVLVYGTAVA